MFIRLEIFRELFDTSSAMNIFYGRENVDVGDSNLSNNDSAILSNCIYIYKIR